MYTYGLGTITCDTAMGGSWSFLPEGVFVEVDMAVYYEMSFILQRKLHRTSKCDIRN